MAWAKGRLPDLNEELGLAQQGGGPEKIMIARVQPIRKPGVEFDKSTFREESGLETSGIVQPC